MAASLEPTRVTVGIDNGGESTSTGDQEGAEWQGEAAEGWVFPAGAQDTDSTSCCTEQTTDSTSIDGSAAFVVSRAQWHEGGVTRSETYL